MTRSYLTCAQRRAAEICGSSAQPISYITECSQVHESVIHSPGAF